MNKKNKPSKEELVEELRKTQEKLQEIQEQIKSSKERMKYHKDLWEDKTLSRV